MPRNLWNQVLFVGLNPESKPTRWPKQQVPAPASASQTLGGGPTLEETLMLTKEVLFFPCPWRVMGQGTEEFVLRVTGSFDGTTFFDVVTETTDDKAVDELLEGILHTWKVYVTPTVAGTLVKVQLVPVWKGV